MSAMVSRKSAKLKNHGKEMPPIVPLPSSNFQELKQLEITQSINKFQQDFNESIVNNTTYY